EQLTYRIVVENLGSRPLTRLQVTDQFDPGLEFVTATQGFQQRLGQVVWMAETLAAGTQIEYRVAYRAASPGENVCHRVQCTSDENVQATDQLCIRVVAAAAAGGTGGDGAGAAPRQPAVTPPSTGPDGTPGLPRSDGRDSATATPVQTGLDAVLNVDAA